MADLIDSVKHAEWPSTVLVLCVGVVLAIIVERARYFIRVGRQDPNLIPATREDLATGRLDLALARARASSGVVARALTAALDHAGRPLTHVSAAVDEVVNEELVRVGRWTPALSALATIALLSSLLTSVFGLRGFYFATHCEPVIRNIPAELATAVSPMGIGVIVCVVILAVRAGLTTWAAHVEAQLRHAAVVVVNLVRDHAGLGASIDD